MDKSKLPLHKREELKRKEDELLVKDVYDEFVNTFSGDTHTKLNKTFVRGEVVNPADNASKSKLGASRLYKPASSMFLPPSAHSPVEAARRKAQEKAEKIMEEVKKNRPQKLGKKKEDKRTSNLEAFKEELKRAQEARAERRVLREQLKDRLGSEKEILLDKIAPSLDNPYLGSYENDPNTTNLFVSNLSSKLTEDELCKMFGHFGPLASVKIMWPRSDDERCRGYNTGFIAYMTRKDAERAVARLKGKNVMGLELKIGWGKVVPIPPNPVYIPPKMLEMALPPPPSGLPFNAQPRREDKEAYRWPFPPQGAPPPLDPEQRDAWEKMIRNATVKVVIPTERQLLCTVHRVVEFAVREGPIFEAVLMNKELNNNLYRFLFDNQSPAHVYYRWKLFSILQGDSPSKWSIEPFRMFDGGSMWLPPPMNFYQQGLPKQLYDDDEEDEDEWVEKGRENDSHHDDDRSSQRDGDRYHRRTTGNRKNYDRSPSPSDSRRTDRDKDDEYFTQPPPPQQKKSQLSEKQRLKVKSMLDSLLPERDEIADAMIYCVEHAEAAEEILDIICEQIFDSSASVPKKIAKLYLISDILNNCTAKVANVSYYRKHISHRLEEIFKHINGIYEKIDARLKAEQFKQRIMACFRSWEDTSVYTNDFLINLQNIFLGLTSREPDSKRSAGDESDQEAPSIKAHKKENDAVRSSLFKPMHQQQQQSSHLKRLVDYDLDGVPFDDDGHDSDNGSMERDERHSNKESKSDIIANDSSMFVRSKWEEIDATAQSSRWDKTEETQSSEQIFYEGDEDIDGVPLDESSTDQSVSHKSSNAVQPKTASDFISSMNDQQRQKLREIEVKVVKFQDELESGQRKRTSGMTIVEEVQKYREKLIQKVLKDDSKRNLDDGSNNSKHHKGKKSSKKDGDEKVTSSSLASRSNSEKTSSKDEKSRGKERSSTSSRTSNGKEKDESRDDRKTSVSSGNVRKRSRSPSSPPPTRKQRSRSPTDSSKQHKKKRH